jgi:hypothetical protein
MNPLKRILTAVVEPFSRPAPEKERKNWRAHDGVRFTSHINGCRWVRRNAEGEEQTFWWVASAEEFVELRDGEERVRLYDGKLEVLDGDEWKAAAEGRWVPWW